MTLAIRLENVSKTFGPVRALAGVSWQLDRGRVNIVRGANGSGKSTLLAILATLIKPTSGRVDHGELGRTRAEVRRSIGWVGHESLCYPDLTGRENIELAARLHDGDWRTAFARAVERFDLGGFSGRAVRTYSRGQKQRIALARALVHRPRLLLLDEPTSGLDPSGRARLSDVVREELAGGATIVAVTHDTDFAHDIGGHEIMLDRGRLQSPNVDSPGAP